MSIRLYGTVTSPYVRRIRILAAELGLACELVNTATDEGQAALRAVSPVWKVPAAEVDGELVLDSHAITELLLARHAGGPIAAIGPTDLGARNALTVIDGALDALINAFYLGKDGVGEGTAYVAKQRGRATASIAWLDARVAAGDLAAEGAFGLPEIALGTTLAWMRFRNTYPLQQHARLLGCLERLEQRPSFAQTRPPA